MPFEGFEAVEDLPAVAAAHLALLRVELLRRDAESRAAMAASGDQHRSPDTRTHGPSDAVTARLAHGRYAAITAPACSARMPASAMRPCGSVREAMTGASMRNGFARMLATVMRNATASSHFASCTASSTPLRREL